jgi:DNA-binding transcriptional ArsR family regulator
VPAEAVAEPIRSFLPAEEDMVAAARFFRVLGDPTRLQILTLLLEREHNVTSLVRALGASQSRISNHLACLRWCHLVTAERRGRQVIYRITDPAIGTLVASTATLIDEDRKQRLACCKRIGSDAS